MTDRNWDDTSCEGDRTRVDFAAEKLSRDEDALTSDDPALAEERLVARAREAFEVPLPDGLRDRVGRDARRLAWRRRHRLFLRAVASFAALLAIAAFSFLSLPEDAKNPRQEDLERLDDLLSLAGLVVIESSDGWEIPVGNADGDEAATLASVARRFDSLSKGGDDLATIE